MTILVVMILSVEVLMITRHLLNKMHRASSWDLILQVQPLIASKTIHPKILKIVHNQICLVVLTDSIYRKMSQYALRIHLYLECSLNRIKQCMMCLINMKKQAQTWMGLVEINFFINQEPCPKLTHREVSRHLNQACVTITIKPQSVAIIKCKTIDINNLINRIRKLIANLKTFSSFTVIKIARGLLI